MNHAVWEVIRRRRICGRSCVTLSLNPEHYRLTQIKPKQESKRALWDYSYPLLQAVRFPQQVSDALLCGTEPKL